MWTLAREILRCPACGGRLRPHAAADISPAARPAPADLLACACGARYPVRKGIPRFAGDGPEDHFGHQWTRFPRTQLDSHSGQPISRERFLRFSGWQPADLTGRTVLDVGCGAGRFTEVALSFGAQVAAVDLSLAVEVCAENLRAEARLDVVQADVARLPFAPGSFDFIYCFGVLQHTPDPRQSFLALPRLLAPGGRLAVDVYPRLLRNCLWPKYWLRPLTSRLSPRALYRLVSRAFPLLYPVSLALGRVPGAGRRLRYAVPVANYDGVYPLSAQQLREWAFLDTFDMLGPRYDRPQSAATVRSWFEEAGLSDVDVLRSGFIVGRGRRG
jgi:SAM-dependent methyltransferase